MVTLGVVIWKLISRDGEHYDKRRILDRTLEQCACAGTGPSRSDLCCVRFIHFGLFGEGWNDRTSSYRGAILTDCRIPYSHAVRAASEKLGKPRFSQTGIQQPTHQDGFLGI